eukprot:gene8608-6044_t
MPFPVPPTLVRNCIIIFYGAILLLCFITHSKKRFLSSPICWIFFFHLIISQAYYGLVAELYIFYVASSCYFWYVSFIFPTSQSSNSSSKISF